VQVHNDSMIHDVINNGYMLLFRLGVIYKYDKNGITTILETEIPFKYASCGLLRNRVYCAGGSPKTATTFSYDIIEGNLVFVVFQLHLFIDTWRPEPSLVMARNWPSNGQLAVVADRWLVTCGSNYDQSSDEIRDLNSCELFDSDAHIVGWSLVQNVPNTFCHVNVAVVGFQDRYIITAGGYNAYVANV
jgi:hypothetical protein